MLADQTHESPIHRAGARIDPVAAGVHLTKNEAKKIAERIKGTMNDKKLSKFASSGDGSTIVIGAIPPSTDANALDGIAVRSITRTHVLSFSMLRAMRFGKGPEGDEAIRVLLAAALINAMVGSNAELHLRENCFLVEADEPKTVLDRRGGKHDDLEMLTLEDADELLAQMPQDPQCEDIVVRAGAKDTYYYSNANMSDNYAMIAQLIEDKDLCVMFAEMVRFNARIYPSATPLKYFQRSPYGLAPEEIEQTWKTMQGRPEFADIEELTNNQNERFLFSTQHLTRRYAKAISDVDEWTD